MKLPYEAYQQLIEHVEEFGAQYYRDLPWRYTSSAYEVWLSEIMLQQTQVDRVLKRWDSWMKRYPCVEALHAASVSDVLESWQGMGYNRRALALKQTADYICMHYGGVFPVKEEDLCALAGIGPSTASGIRAFAYNLPGIYLETNVRAVIIHELFSTEEQVHDKELKHILAHICPRGSANNYDNKADVYFKGMLTKENELIKVKDINLIQHSIENLREGNVATWYYAMLDYGAYLKKKYPNPSRKSKHYVKQSKFEGSWRQKRSLVLKIILQNPQGVSAQELIQQLNIFEQSKKYELTTPYQCMELFKQLEVEGFIQEYDAGWYKTI